MFKPLFCCHRWQILRQGLYPPIVSAAICHPTCAANPMLIHILQPLRHILIVQRLDMLLHGAHPAADGVLVRLVAGPGTPR